MDWMDDMDSMDEMDRSQLAQKKALQLLGAEALLIN
jgi:hypothetical protein